MLKGPFGVLFDTPGATASDTVEMMTAKSGVMAMMVNTELHLWKHCLVDFWLVVSGRN